MLKNTAVPPSRVLSLYIVVTSGHAAHFQKLLTKLWTVDLRVGNSTSVIISVWFIMNWIIGVTMFTTVAQHLMLNKSNSSPSVPR